MRVREYQPTLVPIAESKPIPEYISGRKYDRDWSTVPLQTKQKLLLAGIFEFAQGMESGPVKFESLTVRAADRHDFEGIRRDLLGIDLEGVDLRNIGFDGACLEGANFQDVDLRSADVRGIIWKGANLRRADLRGVNFEDRDFRVLLRVWQYRTELEEADLQGAIYSNKTIWPAFFDPEAAGAILVAD